jgi:uncharacterized protein Usg
VTETFESPRPSAISQGPRCSDGTFEITHANYSDNRQLGDFGSRYPGSAWLQIAAEGAYLAIVIAFALTQILIVCVWPDHFFDEIRFVFLRFDLQPNPALTRAVQLWTVVGFSGALGSASFALKWLYHSVAWREWNRDRIIWRLAVPIQGGLLALFIGAMVISGIIPLLSKQIFLRLLSCAGFGFFVGLFADNFLAALQKFAKRMLGTLGHST